MSEKIHKRRTPRASANTWVVVLAAGDGRRLHQLTTNESGVPVPKQFCSLNGGPSLLRSALRRAETVASPHRICTVVAEQHRHWWQPALTPAEHANVIVQPRNRGTANGILLPLLHIMRRDPQARVVLLPSDHYVDDESVLAAALRGAIRKLGSSQEALLLGIAPDEPDPDLGYIVPGGPLEHKVSSVDRFVEKPPGAEAQRLIKAGALWNAFIVAAHAGTLLDLFNASFPWIVKAMRSAVERDASTPTDPVAIVDLYKQLADLDFSKHVLEGAEARLRVVPVPSCGWSDLGTPTRLAETLRRLPQNRAAPDEAQNSISGLLNLSQQHARWSGEASAGR
jgi:mannose-1-phosphate guanylyltransferase